MRSDLGFAAGAQDTLRFQLRALHGTTRRTSYPDLAEDIDVGVDVTSIGEVVTGEGLEIMNGPDGGGYDHFGAADR